MFAVFQSTSLPNVSLLQCQKKDKNADGCVIEITESTDEDMVDERSLKVKYIMHTVSQT